MNTLARLLKLSPVQSVALPSWATQAARAPDDPGEIPLPNAACLKKFQTWAEQGALSSLEILATELTEKQPEYAAFARFVLNKIETLDLEVIAAYCAERAYKNDKGS